MSSPYAVRQLSIEDGMEIAMWPYPGPWAVADALEPPRPDEGYWAVQGGDETLAGYCCFGEAARPPGLAGAPDLLDVALNLRPELVGKGLGVDFARAVVRRAHEVAGGRGLRCAVARDNEAGRRAAQESGFSTTGEHLVAGGAAVSSYLIMTQHWRPPGQGQRAN